MRKQPSPLSRAHSLLYEPEVLIGTAEETHEIVELVPARPRGGVQWLDAGEN